MVIFIGLAIIFFSLLGRAMDRRDVILDRFSSKKKEIVNIGLSKKKIKLGERDKKKDRRKKDESPPWWSDCASCVPCSTIERAPNSCDLPCDCNPF